MIREHKLLIDKDCPMCRIYGNGFIRAGLLDQNSICAYQDVPEESDINVDFDKAKDEIAFYDTDTGETTYGLQTILKIISHSFPLIGKLLSSAILYKPLSVLYKFISLNRKVIAPSKPNNSDLRICAPTFSMRHRIAYIILVALVTATIVNAFTSALFPQFGWTSDLKVELLICFGQVLWQGIAISLVDKPKRMNYLGNMSTVSMIGGLLLLPVLLMLSFVDVSLPILLLLFFSVIGAMFFEHIRRCKLLDISLWMTASWVLFRVTALGILIIVKEVL